MAEILGARVTIWDKTANWLQSIDWSCAVRRKGPALALAEGLALSGCTGAGRNKASETQSPVSSGVPASPNASGSNLVTSSGPGSSNTSESTGTAAVVNSCPEDLARAPATSREISENVLVFSYLCGGATTVKVYQGPYDSAADEKVVGKYFGVFTEPGKNVELAICFITNGRPVPTHPEYGELPEPPNTHWFELDDGSWAPEQYTFNGRQLETVLPKCRK